MPKTTMYFDGQYLPVSPELLDVFTPGRLFLDGVFETIRCAGGTMEFLNEHVDRMLLGLKILQIKHPHTAAQLKTIARHVIQKNPAVSLGRLRLMVFKAGPHVHCLAMVMPYTPPSVRKYGQGLKVKLIKTNRPASAQWADVKSLDYALFAAAHRRAKAAGCDEAVLINAKGHIFEAGRANIFIILKGRLLTPPLSSGCLNGIIRQQVIRAARDLNIPIAQTNITAAMLKKAEKVFLTNSMFGIIPA